MIAFMPEIYEDELCYSWFARYYCHSGYPAYGYALDDLFGSRTIHFNAEFINGSFQADAKKTITEMMPMEKLILGHTMFPSVRFMDSTRLRESFACMVRQEGKVGDLLPLTKSPIQILRHLRYCPACAKEQREKHGEAYWTRAANIKKLDICVKHRCRLKDTDVILSARQSPRLYVAEHEIKDTEPEFVQDGLELQFAGYLTDVFHAAVDFNNPVHVSDFLKSRLEGTGYLSVSGVHRNITLLCSDYKEFYKDMQDESRMGLPQMQKVFMGYRTGFFEICRIAYFLGIDAEELTAPVLPEKSQEQKFNEKVAAYRKEGHSSKEIARRLGVHPHTVRRSLAGEQKGDHDYSVRKGMQKEDWNSMDKEMLPKVKDACKNLYISENGVPGKVTVATIERILEMPGKRMDYLPECRNEIRKYEETQEAFWARKIVWNYRKLTSEGQAISYTRLCRPLHLKRENVIASLPFLSFFCEKEERKKIEEIAGLQDINAPVS